VQLAQANGGAAQATILGHGGRVPAAMAAFANGAMAHALDYEDALDVAPLHPNASLVPAVLALAQARAPVSGHDLLAAIAIGCEASCRVALALRQPLEQGGWYPPPILGAFGAVTGAAMLLRLTPAQLTDAWSLLLLQNSCPGEIKYSADTVLRAVREAFPAQAAVNAALLAEAGIKGFAAPLEGEAGFYRLFAGGHYEAATLLERREHWYIEALSFKPWPCCRGTHAGVELVLSLQAQHGLHWRDIADLLIEGCDVQRMLAEPLPRKRAPLTAIDAKFSLPFTVATALVKGEVTLDHFTAAALRDPQVLALAQRIHFTQRADWGRDRATAGAVMIQLADGRRFGVETLQPLGHPSRPLDDARLVAKFIDCAGRAATPLVRDRAAAAATALLQLQPDGDVAMALACLATA
jgi:2-methylcitrate dehydratase PrpD